jgi:hypothetical protein
MQVLFTLLLSGSANIFSAPRFGGALGSIDSAEFTSQDLPDAGLSLSHSCFPFRVIDGLPFASSTMSVDPQCLDGLCPGEVDTPSSSAIHN